MGTDNLHHKHKARRAVDVARHKAKRSPYDRVLIVCEGEKTEPNYLCELISELRLNSANVYVDRESNSAPISIVEQAKKLQRKEKLNGNAYDRVYCVFDRDTHTTFYNALDKVSRMNPKNVFHSITSVPCFEYWLLLHFEYITRPYKGNERGKSACDQVVQNLKKHIENYAKSDKGIYGRVREFTSTAITHSKRALREAESVGGDCSKTEMHVLVEYLLELKK